MENYEKDKIREHCQSKIDEFMKGDESYTVYGPYSRPDGRKHAIIITKENGGVERRTVSWPKLMAEILLNGDVWDNDTIDHISRDHTDNDVFNLRGLPLSKHASDDALRVLVEDVICPQCQTKFTPSVDQRNLKRAGIQPAGPFCSRHCTGMYGAAVRDGGAILERTILKRTYFKIDK